MVLLRLLPLIFAVSCASPKIVPIDPKSLDLSEQVLFSLEEKSAKILYVLHRQGFNKALDLYFEQNESNERFYILSKLLAAFLNHGLQKKNYPYHLHAIFASGISARLDLYALEMGLNSHDPQAQFASLYFLAQMHDDEADQIMLKAFASPFDSVRLQAAFYLAKKNKAQGQIHTLMLKLPSAYKPLFAKLFAMSDERASSAILRRLISSSDPDLVLQCVLAIGENSRDDFVKDLRLLLSQNNLLIQEAAAKALGILQDSHSIQTLRRLALSSHSHLSLSALEALFLLGDLTAIEGIKAHAKMDNLYAIILLGKFAREVDFLKELSESKDLQVRTNANIALILAKRTSKEGFCDVLCSDERQLLLKKQYSPGFGLYSYRRELPDASFDSDFQKEYSLHLREELLVEASSQPDFFDIVEPTFSEDELLPLLCWILAKDSDQKSFELLQEKSQSVGHSFLRDYASLALYKKEPSDRLREDLIRYLHLYAKHDFVRFRQYLPFFMAPKEKDFNAEQRTRLFIEIAEALSLSEKGIDALIDAMRDLSIEKQYLLAGIVLSAIE